MEQLPAQMTVIGISKPGGPEVLLPETRPVPTPGPGEILIKVIAAGVNRPDVAQRSGSYPPPPGASDLPGLEVAGEVVAVGPGDTRHKLGDKVMSLVAGGGYAQYCIAQDAQAMTVPPSLSMIEAAAIPETLMTVWHNVFERGALKAVRKPLAQKSSSPSDRRRRPTPVSSSAPTAPSITRPTILSLRQRMRPMASAQMSFSTWSAATTSNAITTRRRSKAAWSRSRFSADPRRMLILPS